ncbi:MAG: tetratricopeptide repeat protein [Campylobacterota bacterium]
MKKVLSVLLFCALGAQASIFSDAVKAYNQKEYKEAFTLFERAANNQSSIQANYFLGLMYLRGRGVAKNLNQAQRFLQTASTIGNKRAQCLLAEVYLQQERTPLAMDILNRLKDQNIVECEKIRQQYNIK